MLNSTQPTPATWVGAFSFRAHPTYNWHCLIWQAASLQAHGATFGSNRYFSGSFSPCRLCWQCRESSSMPAAATLQQQPRFTQRLALKETALHTHYTLSAIPSALIWEHPVAPLGNMMLFVDMKGKAIPELSAGKGRIFLFSKASRVLEPELFTALTWEKVEIKSVSC